VLRTGEISAEAFQAGLEALALMAEVIRGLQCETVMACGTAARGGGGPPPPPRRPIR
jgi:exopolyphosphatase/pppGpp-phosphohydrolase